MENMGNIDIRVENVKTYNGPGVWCSRPSPLSNKYSHKHSSFSYVVKVESRAEAIALYKIWLDEQLKDQNSLASREFRKLLALAWQNKKLVLLCHCVPLDCHVNYIRQKLLESLASIASQN